MNTHSNISAIRKEYSLKSLSESDTDNDPVSQFRKWWTDAVDSSIEEVNAMTLATADAQGKPSARIVLLKGFDGDGFVFFTNYTSHKASDLVENPFASVVFFWKEIERQIRIEGAVEKLSVKENEEYFFSRPFGSRIGAWASPQSQVIENREVIEQRVRELNKEHTEENLNCPPFWGGYRIRPQLFEFWQGRESRLHDRIQYRFMEGNWIKERLAP